MGRQLEAAFKCPQVVCEAELLLERSCSHLHLENMLFASLAQTALFVLVCHISLPCCSSHRPLSRVLPTQNFLSKQGNKLTR